MTSDYEFCSFDVDGVLKVTSMLCMPSMTDSNTDSSTSISNNKSVLRYLDSMASSKTKSTVQVAGKCSVRDNDEEEDNYTLIGDMTLDWLSEDNENEKNLVLFANFDGLMRNGYQPLENQLSVQEKPVKMSFQCKREDIGYSFCTFDNDKCIIEGLFVEGIGSNQMSIMFSSKMRLKTNGNKRRRAPSPSLSVLSRSSSELTEGSDFDLQDINQIEEEARKRATKWRKLEGIKAASRIGAFSYNMESTGDICPTPHTVQVGSNERGHLIVSWNVDEIQNQSHNNNNKFNCVVSILHVPKYFELQDLDLSQLISYGSENVKLAYERVIPMNDPFTMLSPNSYTETITKTFDEGDYCVLVSVRPSLPSINKMTKVATLAERKKIVVRTQRLSLNSVSAHMIGRNTCVLTLQQPEISSKQALKVKMEKLNEETNNWELIQLPTKTLNKSKENIPEKTSQCSSNNNQTKMNLYKPEKVTLSTRPPNNSLKLIVSDVPENSKIRFGIYAIDQRELVSSDIINKYALIILGKPSEIVYSSVKNTTWNDKCSDEDAICTICQDTINFNKQEIESGDDELISIPCNCSHAFHSTCLKQWVKQKKSTCPNCCTKYSHNFTFKGIMLHSILPLSRFID